LDRTLALVFYNITEQVKHISSTTFPLEITGAASMKHIHSLMSRDFRLLNYLLKARYFSNWKQVKLQQQSSRTNN